MVADILSLQFQNFVHIDTSKIEAVWNQLFLPERAPKFMHQFTTKKKRKRTVMCVYDANGKELRRQT
jgi:hypothetical protein